MSIHGARLQLDALPGQRNQLVDAQTGVEQQRDDRVGHRAVLLGLTDEPSALRVAEPLELNVVYRTALR